MSQLTMSTLGNILYYPNLLDGVLKFLSLSEIKLLREVNSEFCTKISQSTAAKQFLFVPLASDDDFSKIGKYIYRNMKFDNNFNVHKCMHYFSGIAPHTSYLKVTRWFKIEDLPLLNVFCNLTSLDITFCDEGNEEPNSKKIKLYVFIT